MIATLATDQKLVGLIVLFVVIVKLLGNISHRKVETHRRPRPYDWESEETSCSE